MRSSRSGPAVVPCCGSSRRPESPAVRQLSAARLDDVSAGCEQHFGLEQLDDLRSHDSCRCDLGVLLQLGDQVVDDLEHSLLRRLVFVAPDFFAGFVDARRVLSLQCLDRLTDDVGLRSSRVGEGAAGDQVGVQHAEQVVSQSRGQLVDPGGPVDDLFKILLSFRVRIEARWTLSDLLLEVRQRHDVVVSQVHVRPVEG